MALKQLTTVAVALLALSAIVVGVSAADSSDVGGNSSATLKRKVYEFYVEVQEVAAQITAAGANETVVGAVEYRHFKASLDELEALWRNGSDSSLLRLPVQSLAVAATARMYSAYAKTHAAEMWVVGNSDGQATWNALAEGLDSLAAAAQSLSLSAAEDRFANAVYS